MVTPASARPPFSSMELEVLALLKAYRQAQCTNNPDADCPVYMEAASVEGQRLWFHNWQVQETTIIDWCRKARHITRIIGIPYIANFIEDARQALDREAFGGGKRARKFLSELDGLTSRRIGQGTAKSARGAPERRIEAVFSPFDIIEWGVRNDRLRRVHNAKMAKKKIFEEILATRATLDGTVMCDLVKRGDPPPAKTFLTRLTHRASGLPALAELTTDADWYCRPLDTGSPLNFSETDVRKLIAAWIDFKVNFYNSEIYERNQSLVDACLIEPPHTRIGKTEKAFLRQNRLHREQALAIKRSRSAAGAHCR